MREIARHMLRREISFADLPDPSEVVFWPAKRLDRFTMRPTACAVARMRDQHGLSYRMS